MNLPATLTGVQAGVSTGPTTFTLTVSGVPSGLSITNSTYGVWCADPSGQTPGELVNFNTNPPSLFDPSGQATYNVYSTYASGLPTDGQYFNGGFILGSTTASLTLSQELAAVNWILNYPKGPNGSLATTTNDEQAAIWQLLTHNGNNFVTASGTDSAAQILYSNSIMYGLNFVPGPGQVVAVLLVPQTPSGSPAPYQSILLPVPVPGTPKIVITKSANTSTANCFQKVTYTYVVTNAGTAVLTNIVVVDDNGTPNYTKDDFVAGTVGSLNPGQSVTFKQTIYLPITEYAVDSNGNENWSTLIPKCLSNGNIQVTFVQDEDLCDNTYGNQCSGGWKSQGGKGFWDNMGTDYARFQFTDGDGKVVMDFNADYFTMSWWYPSSYGTNGIHNNNAGWFAGNQANLAPPVAISTSMTTNLNNYSKFYQSTTNSPANDHDWETKCTYTVNVLPGAFGWAGFGGCKIVNVYNQKCKTGGGHYQPTPVCATVTNTATVTATVSGTSTTLTASAKASVTLNAQCAGNPCQQKAHKCQHQQQQSQCECQCSQCKQGNHSQCSNRQCQDPQCKPQHNG